MSDTLRLTQRCQQPFSTFHYKNAPPPPHTHSSTPSLQTDFQSDRESYPIVSAMAFRVQEMHWGSRSHHHMRKVTISFVWKPEFQMFKTLFDKWVSFPQLCWNLTWKSWVILPLRTFQTHNFISAWATESWSLLSDCQWAKFTGGQNGSFNGSLKPHFYTCTRCYRDLFFRSSWAFSVLFTGDRVW